MNPEIREILGSRYNEVLEKVVGFCHKRPETVYKPKDFVKLLSLDVTSKGLGASLRLRFQEVGLLKIYYLHDAHYGYSEVCGSRECFENWCEEGSILCRTGKGNPNLKFFNKRK